MTTFGNGLQIFIHLFDFNRRLQLTFSKRPGFAYYLDKLFCSFRNDVGFARADSFYVDQVGSDTEGAGPGFDKVSSGL
jgi:hypothetical protein